MLHLNQRSASSISFLRLRSVLTIALASLLVACGGGAGDDDTPVSNDAAIAAIAPLIGVWNLPGNWNGQTNDVAYLLVKTPDREGEAEAVIYEQGEDVTSGEQNCFIKDIITGDITQSLTEELFLSVSAIPSAVVAIQPNGDLKFSVFSETAGTSAPPEREFFALPLGITESGIPICT